MPSAISPSYLTPPGALVEAVRCFKGTWAPPKILTIGAATPTNIFIREDADGAALIVLDNLSITPVFYLVDGDTYIDAWRRGDTPTPRCDPAEKNFHGILWASSIARDGTGGQRIFRSQPQSISVYAAAEAEIGLQIVYGSERL